VARPIGLPFAVRGRHVPADRIRVEIRFVHRVDHLGRDQHRHRRALLLVALEVSVELIGEVLAERRLELLQVLDGVGPLPLSRLPLLRGDVPVARQAPMVGLDERALERVPERLRGSVGVGLPVAGSDVGRLWMELDAHLGHPPGRAHRHRKRTFSAIGPSYRENVR
jgi:hypothetical protein